MLVQTYLSSWAEPVALLLLILILLLRAESERSCSEGGCALPSALRHTRFILVPLVAVLAVLPGSMITTCCCQFSDLP